MSTDSGEIAARVEGSLDNLPTGLKLEKSLEGHEAVITSVRWSPNGSRILTGSLDGSVLLWDAEAGDPNEIEGPDADDPVYAVGWSSDGCYVAAASRKLRFWNADSGTRHSRRVKRPDPIWSVDWSPDRADELATGSFNWLVELYDVEAQGYETIHRFYEHENAVTCVAWCPTRPILASASADYDVRLWNTNRRQAHSCPCLKGHRLYVTCVAWFPDGRRLASASGDRTIRIWDTDSGECVQVLQGVHRQAIREVALSFDGRFLASSSLDHTVGIWTTEDWELLNLLPQQANIENFHGGLDFHPSEYKLAILGHEDEVVHVLELAAESRPLCPICGFDATEVIRRRESQGLTSPFTCPGCDQHTFDLARA